MRTIKELETQLNISKVSLYSMLKKDEFKDHVFKNEKNITVVDEIGQELLKAYYLKEKTETIIDITEEEIKDIKADGKAHSKDDEHVKNIDIISILQDELKEKNNQINSLLNIIDNQQKLEGGKILIENPIKEEKEQEPKGLFKRLFKK